MKQISVTFDTSVIYPDDGQTPTAIRDLERLHEKGSIIIFKTDVVDTELGENKKELSAKSARFLEDMGFAVYGHSRYSHALYGSGSQYPFEELRELVFPNFNQMTKTNQDKATRDAMHLATHYMYRRDFFVTLDNRHLIANRRSLEARFGIIVLTPDECLRKIAMTLQGALS